MKSAKERLIVALDVSSKKEAEMLVGELSDCVGMFKIGMQLFYSEGPAVIEAVTKKGGEVFLDLKLLDIPNTVAQASRVLTRMGCRMIDLHASGGREMMFKAVEAVNDEAEKTNIRRPLVVGVTVLTSISDETLQQELGFRDGTEEAVVRWAGLAFEAGLDGVVSSAREAGCIRDRYGFKLIVTPGIRPAAAAAGEDDQKRILTPSKALKEGATHLVVGRPITRAPDPRQAVLNVLKEMNEAL